MGLGPRASAVRSAEVEVVGPNGCFPNHQNYRVPRAAPARVTRPASKPVVPPGGRAERRGRAAAPPSPRRWLSCWLAAAAQRQLGLPCASSPFLAATAAANCCTRAAPVTLAALRRRARGHSAAPSRVLHPAHQIRGDRHVVLLRVRQIEVLHNLDELLPGLRQPVSGRIHTPITARQDHLASALQVGRVLC